ncbi:MAG: hypothetical protein DRI44_02060, partial [Chlamydiae bacterium]
YKGTVCFVSHDITFVRRIAESIISIADGNIKRFPGGYDYYKEKMDINIETILPVEHSQKEKTKKSQLTREQRKNINRKTNRLKKIIKTAESKVESLENKKTELTKEIELAKTHDDYEKIHNKLKNIEMNIMKYLDEWETAEQQLEKVGNR